MTPEQESQFKLYGCVPRCLIELAKRMQKPITRDEFCSRFARLFFNPQNQFGLLEPDRVPDIASALGIPSVAGNNISPTKLVGLADYDQVAVLYRTDAQILVGSQVNLTLGATDPMGHCSVLEKIDLNEFQLWTPSQDGNDYVLPPFSRQSWTDKQCQAMILV